MKRTERNNFVFNILFTLVMESLRYNRDLVHKTILQMIYVVVLLGNRIKSRDGRTNGIKNSFRTTNCIVDVLDQLTTH